MDSSKIQDPTKPHLTTFKVCNQTPTALKNDNSNGHPVKSTETYKKKDCSKGCARVLQGMSFPDFSTLSSSGFVSTVFGCYNTHHNLVIRPDDVWIAIITQFSFYINKHAEKYRNKFVNFEGQKELTVEVIGVLDAASYDLFVKLMNEQIDKNLVDGEVKAWILPGFSTTTEDDKITAGVLFMASMKKYFKYKCRRLCGIPNISLDVTVEDWMEIASRIQKLKAYDLEEWVAMLQPIVDQFVRAKAGGDVDTSIWNKISSNIRIGSIRFNRYKWTWITAFCLFDEDGNKQFKDCKENAPWPYVVTSDIPNGFAEVDVTIIDDDDNGTEYKSSMIADHFASVIAEDDPATLKPGSGWAMVLKHPVFECEGEDYVNPKERRREERRKRFKPHPAKNENQSVGKN